MHNIKHLSSIHQNHTAKCRVYFLIYISNFLIASGAEPPGSSGRKRAYLSSSEACQAEKSPADMDQEPGDKEGDLEGGKRRTIIETPSGNVGRTLQSSHAGWEFEK